MFSSSKTKSLPKDNVVLQFLKGEFVAIVVSFVLIILTAVLLKFADFSDYWLIPITLFIKAVSSLSGALVGVKGESKGLVKGLIFGMIYVLVAFLTFGILSGSMKFDLSLLLDFAFCMTLCGLVGIIKVNRN